MTQHAISADIRTGEEKTSQIRKSKRVPGIVYGKNQEAISFSLDSSDFLRLYRKAGESNIINLKLGKTEIEVLVQQTQKHPVTGEFTHVDFYAITRGEALQTKISLNFVGEAPATKDGAIIEEIVKELEVKCRPRDLVDHFDVDISSIVEAGDSIKLSDLNLDSEKYETTLNADDVLVTSSLPRVAVEEDTEEAELGDSEGGTEEAESDTEEK